MAEGWAWDETLYAGSAAYYERGRIPYAPGLAEAFASTLGLAGGGRLLDVGCGPGTLTLLLADRFAGSVGLDPDPDMIAEARRRAEQAGRADVRFLQMRAEDLPAGLGVFDVATFGQSFHWMDRDRVAATVHEMLTADGAFVQVSDVKTPERVGAGGRSAPAPPYDEIRGLVRRYLGPVRRAGRGLLVHGTPSDETDVLARSGFRGPERVLVPADAVLTRTIDDVVAWVFSRSDSAPGLFAERLPEFETDLRELLQERAASGRFEEEQPDSELFVWRKRRPCA